MADHHSPYGDHGAGVSWGGPGVLGSSGGYGEAPPSRDHHHPMPPASYGFTSPGSSYPGAGGSYADGGLEERPGASLDDLRNTISTMQASVKESQDRLENPQPVFVPPVEGLDTPGSGYDEYGGMGMGMGMGAGAGGGPGGFGDYAPDDFPQEYRDPDIDTSLLPISQGFLHKKGGGLGGFRRWRKRYFAFSNTQLLYFDSERSANSYAQTRSSKPKGRITIDSFTRVYQGDETKVHRNKDVKWDFVIECNEDRHLELYAETQQEAMWWIESIQLVINACMEANAPRPAASVAPPPLDPEADAEERERRRDAALAHRAYGPGLFEATRGEVASFFIQASDQFGNPMESGGLEFKVTLSTRELEFGVDVRDEGDGTYYVEYTPTQAGEHELEIKIDGEHILGSPASPVVSPAPTSASHCIARGEGLGIAQAGIVNEFTIVAMDQWDDVRPQGGDNWVFRTVGPVSVSAVRDLGNGAYVVPYTVDLTHPDFQTTSRGVPTVEIHAFLSNPGFQFPRPIAGSPFLPRIRMPLEYTGGSPAGSPSAAAAFAAAAAASSGGGGGGLGPGGLPFYSPMTMPGVARAGMTPAAAGTPGGVAASAGPYAPPSPHTPYIAASPSGAPASASSAADAAAAAARLEELQRRERELAARESALRQSEAQLLNEKQAVDMKLKRLAELASRVKVDSERLQQRAQSSAAAAASPAAATPSPFAPRPPPATAAASSDIPPPPPPSSTSAGGDRAAGGAVEPIPPPPPPSATTGSNGYSARTPQLAQPPPPRSSGGVPPPPPAPTSVVSTEAPPELYEPEVLMLFDRHKAVLHLLHQRYCGGTAGVNLASFIDLAKDFDISPVFVTKRDLRSIFVDACRAHSTADHTAGGALDSDHIAMTESLTYPAFVEALGRIAIVALSKPAFHTLYPSSREKVVVMLEMWGLGVQAKVEEITAARA